METFLIRALQLVMSLSLLVIIHEGGHFLFARLFKTRVENSACSLTPGLPFLSSSLKTVIRNMALVGCLWADMSRFQV